LKAPTLPVIGKVVSLFAHEQLGYPARLCAAASSRTAGEKAS